jgi:hypothetical protein
MFFCVLISWDLVWFKIRYKISKFPLSGFTGQSGVHQTLHCAQSGVHRTLHCALSGAPAGRAQIPFCTALSGGSSDSYCALSGVHQTGTVDCPVHP